MTQLDGELRALAVTRVQQQQAAGELTSADAGHRTRARVGERTVWRGLAATEPAPPGRPHRNRYTITGADCGI